MKWMITALTFSTLSAYASQCELDLTQLRDQASQKLALADKNVDGEIVDGQREFEFGYEIKKNLSDEKIAKLCNESSFQENYKNVLRCTEDLYSVVSPQSTEKVIVKNKTYIPAYKHLPVSKWKMFSFCKNHENELAQMKPLIQKTKQCLEGVKVRLSHHSVLGQMGESVFKMARNYDEVFDYCGTAKFQESFASMDMNAVKQCYTQKMENTNMMSELNFENDFQELWKASVSSKKMKAKKMNLAEWQESISNAYVYDDYVAPAVATYIDCTQSFIKGNHLYTFYGDHKFVKCMGEDQVNTSSAETHCAGESEVFADSSSKWLKPSPSRSIASEVTHEPLHSFFGEWQNPNYR